MTPGPDPRPDGGTAHRVLVVGSYPPAATAGTAVTLDVVRHRIAAGHDPVVASPRASAAAYVATVAGPLAGRRLGHLRRHTGATELVFCVERDLPLPATPAGPAGVAGRWLTVQGLVRALAEFERVTLVVCGDLGVPDAAWSPLAAAASSVEHRPAGPSAAGVTVLGPDREGGLDVGRRVGRRVAGRLLGRHYAPARRRAGRAVGRVRGRA